MKDPDQKTFVVSGTSRRLGSVNHVELYVKDLGNCPINYKSGNELDYYQYATRPAMLIYMLQPQKTNFVAPVNAAAAKLVIPQDPDLIDTSSASKGTVYYYNTVAERQEFLNIITKFGDLPVEE